MSVSNLLTEQTFDGDNSTTTFAIPFDYKEKAVVKVYLIDELTVDATTKSGFDETLWVETTNYTHDAASPPVNVIANTAPTTDEKLRVERISPLTQLIDLVAGADGEEATEEALDRIVHVLQELDSRVDDEEAESGGSSSSVNVKAPDWVTSTAYVVDQLAVQNGTLYRCLTAHNSNVFNTDFVTNTYWAVLVGLRGEAGANGAQGAVGNTGAGGSTGSTGADGGDGADGIFSAIASQGEAQAGSDNTKGMSPLRVAEAITAQVDEAAIAQNVIDIAALQASFNTLQSRTTILEAITQQATGKFAGQQVLLNTQGSTVELLGADNGGALDMGSGLDRQESGTNYAKVIMYVRRVTTTEERFASWDLIMQYVDGAWLIGRESTNQLDETLDLDGVTLSVATDGSGRGQVSYITDTMAGSDHDDASVIAWLGQEISK